MERQHTLAVRVRHHSLGHQRETFIRRRWVVADGFLSHDMVPFLDSMEEVCLEIDELAGVYRYRNPQRRRQVLTRSLQDITLYRFNVMQWLDDLGQLMALEPRHSSSQRLRVADHLWHLGEVRIAGTHDFAPVFVGRRWRRAPLAQMQRVLGDAIWAREGVLLCHAPSGEVLARDHAVRSLGELVSVADGVDAFDAGALDRVLRGYVSRLEQREPAQFLQGRRVKLAHFEHSQLVSARCASILKFMWGGDQKTPPVLKWAEVNARIDCGYRSFDEAFGGKTQREQYLQLVRAGGYYQVRRHLQSVDLSVSPTVSTP